MNKLIRNASHIDKMIVFVICSDYYRIEARFTCGKTVKMGCPVLTSNNLMRNGKILLLDF
jgi:hypothetical protein